MLFIVLPSFSFPVGGLLGLTVSFPTFWILKILQGSVLFFLAQTATASFTEHRKLPVIAWWTFFGHFDSWTHFCTRSAPPLLPCLQCNDSGKWGLQKVMSWMVFSKGPHIRKGGQSFISFQVREEQEASCLHRQKMAFRVSQPRGGPALDLKPPGAYFSNISHSVCGTSGGRWVNWSTQAYITKPYCKVN